MSHRFAGLVISLLTIAGAAGQVSGRLAGTVVDSTGGSVPNAQVSLYLTGGDAAISKVKTTSEGRFDFSAIRPDYYRLRIEATGFITVVREDVKVDPGRESTVQPIVVEVAGSTQIVEVIRPCPIGTTGV